jgi:putative tryptophan/tyrosine transport system substrate-binding protein
MKRGKRREARGKKKNMKKRITLWLLATLFLANVSLADAQQTSKVRRIGYLDNSTAAGSAVLLEAFRQELSKLGWIEGKNIAIEYRFGESNGFAHVSELAVDLVRLKVDLIVVASTPPALAAKRATYWRGREAMSPGSRL